MSGPKRCGCDDPCHFQVSLAAALVVLWLGLPGFCAAADSPLTVVSAAVQQSEDAPPVSSGFRFLPGDYLYFTFGISGFRVESQNRGEVRRVSLTYDVRPEDASGVPLTPSNEGVIKEELNPEDKNWTPKRRVSFLLPGFITAGDFHLHVAVKDLVGKTEAAKDFPFHVGGLELHAVNAIAVQGFRFLRTESDEDALDVPAYSPGDTVYVRFEMAGFKTGPQNSYHLSYGVTVLRPDGKPYFEKPDAAELADSSFYPAQYLPGDLTVTTSATSARGQYIVILSVHDLVAKTTAQTKKAFSIE